MEDSGEEGALPQIPTDRAALADQPLPARVPRLAAGVRLALPRLTSTVRERVLIGAELLVVVLWALAITRPYLNMDPAAVPVGREYLSAIQTHHLWTRALECGWCALWNGNVAGGAPAFVDPYGSMLHPLVIFTTLGWGVLNGAKLALVGAFIMGGLAQWWLARVLGLGWVARLWSACLAVAAGHLGGRIAQGTFGLVLSAAACALVLPPLVLLSRTGSRRAAVLLGVTLALAALAGQGYMQIGLALTLPAALLLVPRDRERFGFLMRRFALTVGLAALLAAPFLVPFFHFLPQFGKDIDPAFGSSQPFAAVPLNLVIDDPAFYATDALHKLPYPYLYINFVGWFAVLLALWGLRRGPNPEERRAVAFLSALALLALWIGSGTPLAVLTRLAPVSWLAEQFAGIRYNPLIAGLAAPPILALSGIGLDRLWNADWIRLRLTVAAAESAPRLLTLNLRWLLAIPMLLALRDARVFGANWIAIDQLPPDVPRALAALRTPDLQWVNPPFGEHLYIERAVGMGLKLSYGFRTWRWRDRPNPEPVLLFDRTNNPPGMTPQAIIEGIPLYVALPGREYAAVTLTDGSRAVCAAHGAGGDMTVRCETAREGELIVRENSWSGWYAWMDGQPATLLPGQWLTVDLPTGSHTIEFHYRPWDVPLGLLLCLVGVALALYHWYDRDEATPQAPPTPS